MLWPTRSIARQTGNGSFVSVNRPWKLEGYSLSNRPKTAHFQTPFLTTFKYIQCISKHHLTIFNLSCIVPISFFWEVELRSLHPAPQPSHRVISTRSWPGRCSSSCRPSWSSSELPARSDPPADCGGDHFWPRCHEKKKPKLKVKVRSLMDLSDAPDLKFEY